MADSAGKSETATFLQANGTFLQNGDQGVLATGSYDFGNKGSPTITTQAGETASGAVGTAVLSDTATLSGGYMVQAGSPAPTITFTLIAPDGSTVYTETQTVTGDTSYTTTGSGMGSDVATQVGTYYWNVSYNANGSPYDNSVSYSGQNVTSEELTTVKAQPSITTVAGESGTVVGSALLTDTADLTGGYDITGGTINFTLTGPTGPVTLPAADATIDVTGPGYYTHARPGAGHVGGQLRLDGHLQWRRQQPWCSGTHYWRRDGQRDGSCSGLRPVYQHKPAAGQRGRGQLDRRYGHRDRPGQRQQQRYGDVQPVQSATTQNSSTLLATSTDTVTLSGSTATATSAGYTATATGTDYWVATFNGDSNNSSVTSGATAEPVTITPYSPSINTSQQPASRRGG